MASRYGGITGTEQIANDYQNINIAFENVEADVDAKAAIVSNHINDNVRHVTEAEHTKLASVQPGAEPNQNAFSRVNGMDASTPTDELTIVGDVGVTVTQNPNDKSIHLTVTGESAPGPHAATHLTGGVDPIPVATGTTSGLMPPESFQAIADNTEAINDITAQLADTARVYNLLNNKLEGESDYTQAFQRGLDLADTEGSVHIYVPAGEYLISDTLRIYANTTITMDKNAIIKRSFSGNVLFLNGELSDPNYASGYDGDGNINVIGGIIDLNSAAFPPSSPTDYGCTAFAIAHAENVNFFNVTIKNGQNNHYIDLCACKNVIIRDCNFLDMEVTGTNFYEAVQINPATPSSFPAFGEADFTNCDNVTIDNCTFENVHSGVGNHDSTVDDSNVRVYDTHIKIINCTFRDIVEYAIRPESFKYFLIDNCLIDKTTNESGIKGYCSLYGEISNNIIKDAGKNGIDMWLRSGADYIPTWIKIHDNIIISPAAQGMSLNTTDSEIYNNQILSTGTFVFVLNAAVRTRLRNNLCINGGQLADNMYDGVNLSSCTDVMILDNTFDNSNSTNGLRYGVSNPSGNTRTVVLRNVFHNVKTQEFNNSPTDVLTGKSFGERKLTGLLAVNSGEVTLLDDITKYRYLVIGTGTAGTGMRHEIVRGWFDSGFRPGTDGINVATNNGKLLATIDSATKITITSASDNLRYILGVL